MEESKEEVITEIKREYEYEDILEMLGGYRYFNSEQVQYIYHKLKGDEENANYYLNICLQTVKMLNDASKKLKSEKEIEEINRHLKSIEEEIKI